MVCRGCGFRFQGESQFDTRYLIHCVHDDALCGCRGHFYLCERCYVNGGWDGEMLRPMKPVAFLRAPGRLGAGSDGSLLPFDHAAPMRAVIRWSDDGGSVMMVDGEVVRRVPPKPWGGS